LSGVKQGSGSTYAEMLASVAGGNIPTGRVGDSGGKTRCASMSVGNLSHYLYV